MNTTKAQRDTEAYRDSIATVDDTGKRLWIFPKQPKGRYYNIRTYVSWVLLAFLFGMPWVKVNGEPLLLFNILERKFILFGVVFMPQDFHLFVLAMLTLMLFVVLFTVVYGRIFCGWVCPQTIFMEMVFRKIEYLIEGDGNAQRRLAKAPWTTDKIIKKVGKQAIFFTIAVLVANTFLAYIIGIDEVLRIASEPVQQNLGGFIAMLLFSGAFYFVFSYMREQVCIAICPYGRMQGVLLDDNSIVIHYDFERGEPRGKLKKTKKKRPDTGAGSPVAAIQSEVATAATAVADLSDPLPAKGADPVAKVQNALGDCIDCKLCVQVCPTGIDIRNGTQLECVNCTACIDACDEVMDKIGKPRGLIRYDSYNGIVEKRKKIFTPRVIAYSAVLTVLMAVNVILLSMRTDVEAIILRTPGMLYQEVDENVLSNLYNYQIINKTKESFPVTFHLVNVDGEIKPIGEIPDTEPSDMVEGAFFIHLDRSQVDARKNEVIIEVRSGEKVIDRVTTSFMGPMK